MTNVMEKPMRANTAPQNAVKTPGLLETEPVIPAGQSVPKKYLLTAAQMAQFVQDGLLMFDGLVPQELNEAVYADQQAGKGHWQTSEAIRAVFDWLPVRGMIQSLVSVNPVYDHSALHVVGPQKHDAQVWHADSIIDARPFAFDIQAMYFSHDAPKEMGPTLVLPGSHLRRTSNVSIARYKNIVGQKQLIGKAGTIAFLHHGLWHCAQPNFTDNTRYMFKLRLRPARSSAACSTRTATTIPKLGASWARSSTTGRAISPAPRTWNERNCGGMCAATTA